MDNNIKERGQHGYRKGSSLKTSIFTVFMILGAALLLIALAIYFFIDLGDSTLFTVYAVIGFGIFYIVLGIVLFIAIPENKKSVGERKKRVATVTETNRAAARPVPVPVAANSSPDLEKLVIRQQNRLDELEKRINELEKKST